jgi:hypothetical protein
MGDKPTTAVAQRPLICQECRRSWLDAHERWRLYLDPDERRTVPYCAVCAEREFGQAERGA